MIQLRKKTFFTIFLLMTSFIILITLVENIDAYKSEKDNIKSILVRVNDFVKPLDKEKDNPKEDNKLIMDYDVYTFLLDKNNNIIAEISHNNSEIPKEILNKSNKILNSYKTNAFANNLFFSNYSYSYRYGEYLIILDSSYIRKNLFLSAFIYFCIVLIFEILVFYISKEITIWITKPVYDSFDKQKEFIANASHELKTPLAVIMASTYCIDVNKKNEKYINNLKCESERMNNLITRLLVLSKSEVDVSEKKINNLSKIIEKRLLVFESIAFENNVLIESNICKDIMFNCNNVDIDELVGILIDNAIKHSYKDSTIVVNLYIENNNIVLEVINNGEEIPREEYDKIFERFYRKDVSRNRDSNRYGLGLSIAKNIVNNYNGKIKVFCENNYTTFKITLKK